MVRRTVAFLAAVSALLFLQFEPAAAENRIALVIGNNNYVNIGKLTRPANDAHAVGKVLETLGFSVTAGIDLDHNTLAAQVHDFSQKIQPGDIAFLYYAGHGVAIHGNTYLIPTDLVVKGLDPAGVEKVSLAESDILTTLGEHKPRVVVMVLDTNRNNPFVAHTRSISRGLAVVTDRPSGTFVIYSTGLGQTCLDGLSDKDPSPNSVFARIFITELARRDANLLEIALSVRAKVRALAATVNHPQSPAYYDNLTALFRLAAETQTKDTAPAK
jgi:Caspase domain